jgi:hypothetical protein
MSRRHFSALTKMPCIMIAVVIDLGRNEKPLQAGLVKKLR